VCADNEVSDMFSFPGRCGNACRQRFPQFQLSRYVCSGFELYSRDVTAAPGGGGGEPQSISWSCLGESVRRALVRCRRVECERVSVIGQLMIWRRHLGTFCVEVMYFNYNQYVIERDYNN